MLEIDGSYLEGGGAIARTAVGLSVATGKPIHIHNIRKNRPNPGLAAQHLAGIKAVAELCGGKLEGAEIGSTEIKFFPGKNFKEKIKVFIETAGSVGLVLQVLQLACLKAEKPVKVEISGGATYGKWAPPIDFVENVTYKTLEKAGYKIDLHVEKHGFYPQGGAYVTAVFNPVKELEPLDLGEQGKIIKAGGISVASKALEGKKVAERQKVSARGEIFNKLGVSTKIKTEYVDTFSIGSGITLWLETDSGAILGSAEIGEQRVRAEIVGKTAAESLIKDFKEGAAIGRRALDQIIPFLAFSKGGKIKFSSLSGHSKTNLWVCEKFFGKIFDVRDKFSVIEKA